LQFYQRRPRSFFFFQFGPGATPVLWAESLEEMAATSRPRPTSPIESDPFSSVLQGKPGNDCLCGSYEALARKPRPTPGLRSFRPIVGQPPRGNRLTRCFSLYGPAFFVPPCSKVSKKLRLSSPPFDAKVVVFIQVALRTLLPVHPRKHHKPFVSFFCIFPSSFRLIRMMNAFPLLSEAGVLPSSSAERTI